MSNLKKSLAALTVSLAALTSTAALASNDKDKCNTSLGVISVVGQGEVKVMPDQAKLEYKVTSIKPSAEEARNEVEKTITTFSKSVEELKLEKNSFVADSLNIYPRYTYNQEQKRQVLEGYEAQRSVSVTITDFALIAKLNDLALKAGINNVAGFEYSVIDRSKYEKEATQKAILNAKEQAQLLAEGFNVNIEAPCALSYGEVQRVVPYRAAAPRALMAVADNAPAVESTYTLEPIVISSSVKAEFSTKAKKSWVIK